MQTSHHYIATHQQRSRSPSPVPYRRDTDEANDDEVTRAFYEGGDKNFEDDDKKKFGDNSNSSSRSARINEMLHHSHPVDPLVTIRRDSPSPSGGSVKELLIRPGRSRTNGDGSETFVRVIGRRRYTEMDELAGAVRSYGSIDNGPLHDINSGDQTPTSDSETAEKSHSRAQRLNRQKSFFTPAMEDELRKRNKLYFLDPITKLKHFHGFPWKLSLQIIKMILITIQVVIFGGQRENMVEYFERSDLAFRHLLLKNWDPGYETMPYPPATGQYAIYTMKDLFEHMNDVMENYYKLPEAALATVHLDHDRSSEVNPIKLCFRANAFIEYPNGTYIVSANVLHNCTEIQPFGEKGNWTYNVSKYLEEINFKVPFNRTLDITLSFHVNTFHLNLLETHYGPTCYNVNIDVVYKNSQRSGQLLVDLLTTRKEITCKGKILSAEVQVEMEELRMKVIAYDAVVMAVCCLSTILCARSLKRCNNLRRDTARFFKLQRGRPFRFSNHMEYINMWYIIIVINDILTIIGSALKIQLESRVFSISSENYEVCSIVLGIGIFLTYVGILRYLGFFKSYNVLILTLKTSFPHVMRFLVCAVCLYTGFLFCGWVVFSPYHIKFRTLSTASECLFSLVNGDDMFVTFSALTNNSDAIWYFHRAYLYIFISIFIYVVLSVFIAVIMDNYENLKHYYEKGFPETEVQKFIMENGEMPVSEIFSHVRREGRWQDWFFCIFPCFACFRSSSRVSKVARERQDLLATI